METIEDVILEIILHDQNNPTHGKNCACMDVCIQAIRRMIYKLNPSVEERMRIEYVIRSVISR